MSTSSWFLGAMLVTITTCLARPCWAADAGELSLPATAVMTNPAPLAQVQEPSLAVRGQGRLTYYFWKIYDVELFLPLAVPSAEVLAEHPRRLAFTYLRAFTAEDLAKATTKTMHERQGADSRDEITAGLTAINGIWPEVKPGDRLELFYDPTRGTTVSLNGKILGQVSGAAFSRVLFSIWLGEKSIDESLREKLLGKV